MLGFAETCLGGCTGSSNVPGFSSYARPWRTRTSNAFLGKRGKRDLSGRDGSGHHRGLVPSRATQKKALLIFASPPFHILMWAALSSSLSSCADTNAPGSRASSRVHGARRSGDPLGAIAAWQRGDAGAQADSVSWGRVRWNEPICAAAHWTHDPGRGGSSMRRIVRLRGGAPGRLPYRSAGDLS